ncbi:hypothetical protein Taro_005037 [Colocasia esculenta]|uniref:C2H2-type domain-containing protein n=1 Tax=Colocasia esculenta TaxID=4460 RepID=A0A843TTB1_COLES|nr:hypothetical protein [Colocasia esculenta]
MVSAAGTFSRPPGVAPAGVGDLRHPLTSEPRVPLSNLTLLGQRVEFIRRFLADSLDRHADIGGDKLQAVSSEIASAVQQIIVNGAALLAFSQTEIPPPPPAPAAVIPRPQVLGKSSDLDPAVVGGSSCLVAQADGRDPVRSADRSSDLTAAPFLSDETPAPEEIKGRAEEDEDDGGDYEIVEMDAVELLAEHVHFCDICGKGFKRDANLRMHMRAHGNQFKTMEALSKPDHRPEAAGVSDPTAPTTRKRRFSCPYFDCNRNRTHKRFRPLKSAVCVKNHFRRSHCPKIYSCTRCNKKSFSVLADLKSHLKHCGECRWRCSCGTSFSRKDKLFGHMALFEGHMPAFSVGIAGGEEDEVEEKVKGLEEEEEVEEETEEGKGGNRGSGLQGLVNGDDFDPEFFEELMVDEFGTVDGSFCKYNLGVTQPALSYESCL